MKQTVLDFYARPAAMTSAGRHAALFDALPGDVPALVRIVQGLAIHQYAAPALHGVEIEDARRSESHIRAVERMLDRLLAIDERPLAVARALDKRLVGVCHTFAGLLLALLRFKGIPARARWGFGTYFNPPYFEDHVLCEVWNLDAKRWVLVEPQLDDLWQAQPNFDFDALDVPRDRFLIAADAWTRCRAGQADAAKFGIFQGDQRGLWFIACSLMKDLAALNKTETLPWDVWGAMPRPGETLHDEQLAFFDRLAALTRDPDASFDELCARYESDARLRVPPIVFNAVLGREERIEALHP